MPLAGMVYSAVLAQKRGHALQKIISEPGGVVELMIGTTNYRKEGLARALDRIGEVRACYSFVPYIAFRCQASDAAGLVSHINGRGRFYRELKAMLSVEASGTFSIPKIEDAFPKPKKKVKAEDVGSSLWNLVATGAYKARQYSCGENTNVAVIDTGANYLHPEIQPCFNGKKGHNFLNNTDFVIDDNGHGTHVSGIIAGRNCGVAPKTKLAALKVLNKDGEGSESAIISALEWCVKNNMDVANLSLGAPVASSAFEEMCSYAASAGLLIVAAAGNDGKRTITYPAGFGEPVIGVAATDRENNHAVFSNISPTNDISAPGVDILSSYLSDYAVLDGTSMSAPHVAGALSLAVSYAKKADLEDVLERTAQDLTPEKDDWDVFGAGLLRADLFMSALARSRRVAKALNERQSLAELVRKVFW